MGKSRQGMVRGNSERNISSIKHKLVTGDIPIGENILKICEIIIKQSYFQSEAKTEGKTILSDGDRRSISEASCPMEFTKVFEELL
jgi:hypothetical protein